MNKKVRELMEKHNLSEATMTMHGLEIERIAEDYAEATKELLPDEVTTKQERLQYLKDIGLLKSLQHHKDTTVGLWATDRPDLIEDPKKIMFQIKEA